jgi:hypothetical protein
LRVAFLYFEAFDVPVKSLNVGLSFEGQVYENVFIQENDFIKPVTL